MPPTVISKMPQNQLDALPLIDAGTVANSGDVQILGNRITRYWSPTALGLSGAAFVSDGGAGGGTVLATPFLDVRGCRAFTILLRRINVLLAAALPDFFLWGQYRFSTGEVPLFDGSGDRLTYLEGYLVNNITISFPAMQTAGEVQTATRGWHVGQEPLAADQPQTIGMDLRVVVTCTVAPAVANTFSMAIWGVG